MVIDLLLGAGLAVVAILGLRAYQRLETACASLERKYASLDEAVRRVRPDHTLLDHEDIRKHFSTDHAPVIVRTLYDEDIEKMRL